MCQPITDREIGAAGTLDTGDPLTDREPSFVADILDILPNKIMRITVKLLTVKGTLMIQGVLTSI